MALLFWPGIGWLIPAGFGVTAGCCGGDAGRLGFGVTPGWIKPDGFLVVGITLGANAGGWDGNFGGNLPGSPVPVKSRTKSR